MEEEKEQKANEEQNKPDERGNSPDLNKSAEKREEIFKKLRKEFVSKKIGLYVFFGVIILTAVIIIILNHFGGHKKINNIKKAPLQRPETKEQLKKQKKNMNQMLNLPPVNGNINKVSLSESPEIKTAITKIKSNIGQPGSNKMSLREKLRLKALVSPIIATGQSNASSPLAALSSQINALKNIKPFNPTAALSKIPQMQEKALKEQGLANLQKTNPNQGFLNSQKQNKTVFTKVERPAKPVSPHEVEEGTIIPAVLMTKIDSNLPGMIKAQVVQNVYSYNGRYLEIPKGSFIIGMYSSQIAANQSRLLVAFNVLELPNGEQVNLMGSEGANTVGEAGFHDLVNTHFWQMFGTSLLLSIINVGSQMYGYNSGNMGSSAYGTSSPVTSSGLLIQGGSQALSTTGQNILQKYANIPPTIIIRQGYRFNVFVSKNMVIKPYK
ncbi:MAG: TrbI/VirB10 family protein [Deltaproteobacteria bacterium]|jgi:type IV secretion system protein VirB10|nr:TrbI/VirB10 family protein [Deltaproteobacteria bacterium]